MKSVKNKILRNDIFWFVLEMVFVLIFIVMIIIIARRFIHQASISYEEHSAAVTMQKSEQTDTIDPYASKSDSTSASPVIQPEIAELQKQNPDAVGLLHFEGDRTLYVCQTTDNSYYKSHRFDGSEDPAGMIYMDYRNKLSPRSDNIILYGHNMRDGSRFGTLKRFEKKEYLKRYPIFQFDGLYETVNYVPFAIFHTTVLPYESNYFAFDQIDFENIEEYSQFIRNVKSRSVLDIPVDVSYGDKLLTLVTCYSRLERGRLIIICREVKACEDCLFPY